jgi:hypothetical protein
MSMCSARVSPRARVQGELRIRVRAQSQSTDPAQAGRPLNQNGGPARFQRRRLTSRSAHARFCVNCQSVFDSLMSATMHASLRPVAETFECNSRPSDGLRPTPVILQDSAMITSVNEPEDGGQMPADDGADESAACGEGPAFRSPARTGRSHAGSTGRGGRDPPDGSVARGDTGTSSGRGADGRGADGRAADGRVTGRRGADGRAADGRAASLAGAACRDAGPRCVGREAHVTGRTCPFARAEGGRDTAPLSRRRRSFSAWRRCSPQPRRNLC